LRPAVALSDLQLHSLAFLKAAVAVCDDRREVYEDVFAAVDRNEAVALVGVEPLDSSVGHP
jgi:hypothetical protein